MVLTAEDRLETREGVTIAQAAAALGVSVRTIKRWISDGAPVVDLGAVGRTHATLVCVDSLSRWRYGLARDERVLLRLVAGGLRDIFVRDGGVGPDAVPLW